LRYVPETSRALHSNSGNSAEPLRDEPVRCAPPHGRGVSRRLNAPRCSHSENQTLGTDDHPSDDRQTTTEYGEHDAGSYRIMPEGPTELFGGTFVAISE